MFGQFDRETGENIERILNGFMGIQVQIHLRHRLKRADQSIKARGLEH